jgi:hypothetical protein
VKVVEKDNSEKKYNVADKKNDKSKVKQNSKTD